MNNITFKYGGSYDDFVAFMQATFKDPSRATVTVDVTYAVPANVKNKYSEAFKSLMKLACLPENEHNYAEYLNIVNTYRAENSSKIATVKAIRLATDLGIMESKQWIETVLEPALACNAV